MSPRVLTFHYILTDTQGKTIDSSRNAEPFMVMEGAHQIIPGLEKQLTGMQVGDRKTLQVPAAEAYGTVNEKLRIKVTRQQLPEGDIQVGTMFRSGEGPRDPIFTVTKMEGEEISLDGNHPLAGQDLTFDVEIMAIREATADELQHGHAHGPHAHEPHEH